MTMQTETEKQYWALAIRVRCGEFERIDSLCYWTPVGVHIHDIFEKIEAQLQPNETLMDYVAIDEKTAYRCPQCFISKDGWIALNPEVFPSKSKPEHTPIPTPGIHT